MAAGLVRGIHVGRIAPLGPDGIPSGFFKQPVAGRVEATQLGLSGDEQADLRVHGGIDKAVYAYPGEGYADWLRDFPARERTLVPGGMGENLVTAGLDEDSVRIGDLHRIGSALFQVTQPRQPCAKLALYHREPKLPKRMTETARCGWYLRVVEAGPMQAGDSIELIDRNDAAWSIRRFAAVVALKSIDRELLAEIVAMPGVAAHWQVRALKMLAAGRA